MMNVFIAALFAFLASAGIAEAGPVVAAATAVFQWGAASAVNSFLLSTALSTGLSVISQMIAKRNQPRNNGGIKVQRPTSGDATCANIILGRYATAGNHVAPPYAQGHVGDTPNAFLTQIIDLADYPFDGFARGVWIGEDWVELDPTPTPIGSKYPGRLVPVIGNKYHGNAWFKFYDGRQTEADPVLLQTGTNGPRPWSADMIGRGVAYVVSHFEFEPKLFSGEPELLFEVFGARLYDPRKDSSVGGTGSHRYGDVTTYEYTENPIVMIYNIMRGIPLPDGTVWGGDLDVNALPLSNWIAAMNKCDVPRADGKPTYRAAIDISIGPEEFEGDEPASAIEELMSACSATIAEVSGGVWHIRVGGPDLPVAFLTDDDIIITEDERFDPFPSIDETINGLQSQYPEPRERWVSKQAPTRYSAQYETDDMGQRKIGNLSLPTVTDALQVQMLMDSYVQDGRRFRRNEFTLPPDYLHVTVLDSVGYNSEANGYINNKVFEVAAKGENLVNLNSRFSIRERDQGDYDWTPDRELPSVVNPPAPSPEPVQIGVPGVTFEGHEITDADGRNRRPAALMTWQMEKRHDISAIAWEIRPLGQTRLVSQGTTHDVMAGRKVITDGIYSQSGGVNYEGRAKVEAPRRVTDWSGWQQFHVADIRFSWEDLTDDISADFDRMVNDAAAISELVEQNRQAIAAEVARAQAEADEIRQQVVAAQDAVAAETARAVAEAAGLRSDLAAVQTDLSTTATAIRGELATAEAGLSDDISDLHDTITAEYTSAITSGIQTYDVTVQGQFTSMAGQIEELTAKLTSDDLVQNGKFSAGDLSYWTTTGTAAIYTKTGNPGNALIQAAPVENMVRLNQNATLEQTTESFTLTSNDRFRIRFSAATDTSNTTGRNIELRLTWLDGTDATIGTPEIVTLATPQQKWGVLSAEFDPPDTAVKAEVRFRHAGASATFFQYVTAIEANTADHSIEAEITTIKGTIVNLENSLATYKTEVATRFGAAESAITTEQNARASADNAIGQRIDTVTADLGTVSGQVQTNATAIATANDAISALDTRVTSTFGHLQLLRDGDFSYNFTYWPGGDVTALSNRNKAATNWALRDMPGRKAVVFRSTSGASRATDRFEVSPSERYSFGFFVGRTNSLSSAVKATLQFENATGTILSATGNSVSGSPAAGSYVYYSADDIVPPVGTTHGRFIIERETIPALDTHLSYVTGLSLRRMSENDMTVTAEISSLQTSYAGLDQSFASWQTAVNTRFNENETAITSETSARTSADSALGGRIDSLTTRVGTAETNITSETSARTSADTALGGRIDSLTTRVGTAETNITSETSARTSADSALGGRIDSLTTRVGTAESEIDTTQVSLSNLDAALATYKTQVNTRFSTNESNLSTETTSRTNADNALGVRIDQMGTRVGNAETRISTAETAITNANNAIGAVSSEIQTKFGDTQLVRDPDFSEVLKYWTGGTLATNADVHLRDKNSTDFRYSQMPGRRALLIRNNMGNIRLSPQFDVSPAEVYDLSFYVARKSDSASVRVGIRWFNNSGAQIGGNVTVLAAPAAGAWRQFSLPDLKPPASAVSASVIILFGVNGTNATDSTFLTAITLRRRAAFEFAASAGISEAKLAASDVDSALTQYKTEMNTRVGDAEADITEERLQRTTADSSLSGRIDAVTSRVGTAESNINSQQTALTTVQSSIANVEQTLTSQFGNAQLIRDPDFGENLDRWTGGLGDATNNIITKNPDSTWLIIRNVPGRKAFRINNGAIGNRNSNEFPVSPNETYDYGFYGAAGIPSPNLRINLQFLNAARNQIGVDSILLTNTGGAWEFFSKTGIKPPDGAVTGRIYFTRDSNGTGGATDWTYLTGIEVWRQTAASVSAQAQIDEVRQTAASATQSIAALETTTNAKFGASTAYNRLRVQSVANAGGSVSRIALTAATSGDLSEVPNTAAIWIETRSDGLSQVAIEAERLLFATGNGTTGRKFPFFIDGGVAYIESAMIRNADITYLKLAGKTLYVPRYWSRADVTLGAATSNAAPFLLFDRNIPDFDGGGYVITFDASVNTRSDYDKYARFQILVDGVVVKTQSTGLRTSGANTGGELACSMSASYYGSGTTNVKVRGWSHTHTSYSGGDAQVVVQNMSLTIAGSRR